jgi:hypothetical protein
MEPPALLLTTRWCQHTEKVVLGDVDAENNSPARRLGTDLFPVGLLAIRGAVSMLFHGDTSYVTAQA